MSTKVILTQIAATQLVFRCHISPSQNFEKLTVPAFHGNYIVSSCAEAFTKLKDTLHVDTGLSQK
jgi:hypothetical protein